MDIHVYIFNFYTLTSVCFAIVSLTTPAKTRGNIRLTGQHKLVMVVVHCLPNVSMPSLTPIGYFTAKKSYFIPLFSSPFLLLFLFVVFGHPSRGFFFTHNYDDVNTFSSKGFTVIEQFMLFIVPTWICCNTVYS